MPAFKDGYTPPPGHEIIVIPHIKAYVCNDDDAPPNTLIGLYMYDVPFEDVKKGKVNEEEYENEHTIDLLPEDAIKFAKQINMLVGEIFKEENYRGRFQSKT